MKKLYIFLLSFVTISGFAQPPAGYYNSATGTGYTLKTQLYNIIKNHDDQGYNAIDDFFTTADKDIYFENDNTILDPYSERPLSTDPYNYSTTDPNDVCGNYNSEGDCYNPEHVIPQSVFSQAAPMRGDAHHLLPTDGRVNGFRSNYPFGVAGTLISQSGISNPTMNGSKLGNNLNSGYSAGYTGIVFEPIDEFKGDIARIYFYFVTRYQNVITTWGAYPMFDGTSDKVIADPFLNILLTWNQMDPVSPKEIARNNAVYSYQGNRNPFIDNPDYICMIWSAACSLSSSDFAMENLVVYPNPSHGNIAIQSGAPIDEITVVNVSGQMIRRLHQPVLQNSTYAIENLPAGFYFVNITSSNLTVTRKVIVN
jgi:endonuclease I